jgi:hypothetical protein
MVILARPKATKMLRLSRVPFLFFLKNVPSKSKVQLQGAWVAKLKTIYSNSDCIIGRRHFRNAFCLKYPNSTVLENAQNLGLLHRLNWVKNEDFNTLSFSLT